MTQPEVLPTEDLRAWDWRADLKRDERGIPWLARQTHKSQTTVYSYAYGTRATPIAWLEEVARLLGKATTP
jgi:hypothetical protein